MGAATNIGGCHSCKEFPFPPEWQHLFPCPEPTTLETESITSLDPRFHINPYSLLECGFSKVSYHSPARSPLEDQNRTRMPLVYNHNTVRPNLWRKCLRGNSAPWKLCRLIFLKSLTKSIYSGKDLTSGTLGESRRGKAGVIHVQLDVRRVRLFFNTI